MADRLDRTALSLGVEPAGRDLIARAFHASLIPRRAAALDEHHPDFLHPARTALILMDDAAVADPVTLAAALTTETRDPALRITAAALAEVGPAVGEVVARVPGAAARESDPERLIEDLLVAGLESLQVAVAERLDHARHLHLRDRAEWEAYHAVTCRSYAPLAARAHRRLGDRLIWWCRTFSERFLGTRRTDR